MNTGRISPWQVTASVLTEACWLRLRALTVVETGSGETLTVVLLRQEGALLAFEVRSAPFTLASLTLLHS